MKGTRSTLGAVNVKRVLLASPRFLTAPLWRRWHLRWGATDAEVASTMPGDEIVPDPSSTPPAP